MLARACTVLRLLDAQLLFILCAYKITLITPDRCQGLSVLLAGDWLQEVFQH